MLPDIKSATLYRRIMYRTLFDSDGFRGRRAGSALSPLADVLTRSC